MSTSPTSVLATQDRGTLMIQLARLQADQKALIEVLNDRRSTVERATKEIIQYEAVLGYNASLIEGLTKQVAEVEAVASGGGAIPAAT